MALDASVLQVRVESVGINDATKALNELAAAGGNAEKATSNIGSGAKAAAKVQVDAAQEAMTNYNAVIDMMSQKAETFYATQSNAAVVATQKELFAGMALVDKLSAIRVQAAADDAARRAKESSDTLAQQQKILDLANKRYSAEQDLANKMNAAYDNKAASKASKDSDDFVASLKRQAEMVGLNTQQLREYSAQANMAKAAQLGVTGQVSGFIDTIKNAKGPHESFNILTAGSTRELLVLGHELSQGSFQRFGGSLIVLAERINFLPNVLEKAGVAAAALNVSIYALIGGFLAIVAVVATATITAVKSATALHEMKDAVILTGGAAGATGDAFYQMANRIGDSTGEFGKAREAVLALANTGRFTADQIGMIAEAAVGLEKYAGVAIDKTAAQFERLAAEPLKATDKSFKGVSDAAMQLNQQLHFLEPSVLAEIIHFERIGDAASASKVAINALAGEEKKRVEELKENLSPLGKLFDDLKEGASRMWNEMFHVANVSEQIAKVQEQIQRARAAGHGDDYFTIREGLEKLQSLQNKFADDNYKAEEKAHNQRINNATNLTTVYLRNLSDRSKGEETFEQRREVFEKNLAAARARASVDPAYAAQTKDLISPAAEAAMLDQIRKDSVRRQAKPKSEGLSGLDKTLADINEQYEVQKRADDNAIKLYDFMVQNQLMSASAGTAAKGKLLEKEMSDQQTALEKELTAIDAFHTTDIRLSNDAAIKKSNILKQLGIVRENIALRQKENSLVPDAEEAALQKIADEETKRFLDSYGKQAQAIQEKIEAYNRLPEAMRAAGVTEKQMQDQFTQSAIDFKNEQIASLSEFGKASDDQIKRLIAERNALVDLTEKQRAWEAIQKKNQQALNAAAGIKAAAAEQVKLWKDAGNEIEKALTSAFGNAGAAAGKMFKAFAEGQASQIDIAQKIKEAKDREVKDGIDQTKLINDLQLQGAQAQLGSYASMADAASAFFDKGSKGYQAMTRAAQILHVAEVALSVVKGVNAVLSQLGGGDPYTAFARGAAMAAVVAGLGVALSGGSGAGSFSSADQQKIQGTGTVLGSPTITSGTKVELVGAKSDSIANSLKIAEKTSGLGLAVQNDMLTALQKLNTTIGNFATELVKSTNISNPDINLNTSNGFGKTVTSIIFGGVLGPLLSKIPVLGNLFDKIGTSIFGGKQTLDDSGFTLGKTSLGSALSGGVNAQTYANITTSGGWFSSDKHSTQTSSIGSDANSQIAGVIGSMTDVIKSAATSLGLSGDAFTSKLNSFVIDIGNVSLKGLTGDQITSALNAVFSKLGDQMAAFAFFDLQQFQKVGEGMLETVARVANDFSTVNQVFSVLGKTIPQGLQGISQAEKLITAFVDSDTLSKAVKQYEDAIYSDSDKLAPIIQSVQDQLNALGYGSITTKEAFKQAVDSLDLTTDAGVAMFQKLTTLAPTFGAAIDGLAKTNDSTKSSIQSVIDKLKDFSNSIKQFRDGLVLGANSPLTPVQKLAEAQSQFQSTITKALSGDSTAQGNVTGIAQTLLDAAKTVYASSDDYTNVFNLVQSQLAKVQGFADNGVTTATQQLNTLNDQLTNLQTLNTTTNSILAGLNTLISGSSPVTAYSASFGVQIRQVVDAINKSDSNNTDALANVAAASYDGQQEAASTITDAMGSSTTTSAVSAKVFNIVKR